jgi:aminopeptidase
MDDDKLARFVVRYSAAVQPGEVVSLIGPPAAEPLVTALYREVLRAGAHPLVLMRPEACEESLCREGGAEQLGFIDPLEEREVEVADVAIHLVPVPAAVRDIDPARHALHEQARRPLLEAFLRRCRDRRLRWTAVAYPRRQPPAECDDILWQALFLDKPEPAEAWQAQERRQARLIAFLETIDELRLCTPSGTDLRVCVAARHWCNGAGRQNLPDGEVFTAPVETETRGTVCFAWPTIFGGQIVEGVRLQIRDGRVVEASARRGEQALHQLLQGDEASGTVGEIGLGCNFVIGHRVGHPLVDEKMGGTFHLALGMALPETGGLSRAAVHCDLMADLRQGGRIEAAGRLISDNGRFMEELWPVE